MRFYFRVSIIRLLLALMAGVGLILSGTAAQAQITTCHGRPELR